MRRVFTAAGLCALAAVTWIGAGAQPRPAKGNNPFAAIGVSGSIRFQAGGMGRFQGVLTVQRFTTQQQTMEQPQPAPTTPGGLAPAARTQQRTRLVAVGVLNGTMTDFRNVSAPLNNFSVSLPVNLVGQGGGVQPPAPILPQAQPPATPPANPGGAPPTENPPPPPPGPASDIAPSASLAQQDGPPPANQGNPAQQAPTTPAAPQPTPGQNTPQPSRNSLALQIESGAFEMPGILLRTNPASVVINVSPDQANAERAMEMIGQIKALQAKGDARANVIEEASILSRLVFLLR